MTDLVEKVESEVKLLFCHQLKAIYQFVVVNLIDKHSLYFTLRNKMFFYHLFSVESI